MTEPKHISKKFDYVVSNPPFKLDFSDERDAIANLPNVNERFFADIPKVPNKNKDKMAIYLLFIQHIMFSLTDAGRAAVVVPTGFLTAQSGIEKSIREKLVDKRWLKGAVSMPSNIFATTGTNVSVIFIDKSNSSNVVLVDASKLGKKIKDGKNQRTVLSHDDELQIISAFNSDESVEDFSVILNHDEIKNKNYSFSAGQYFDIKIEYSDITTEEFNNNLEIYKSNLNKMFIDSRKLEEKISESLGKLRYDK